MSSSDPQDKKLSSQQTGLDESDLGFQHWQLPDVTETDDGTTSNLFGKFSQQSAVKPTEVETILPPTMAEIEDIRAQAETEGFNEGKQQGFEQGREQGRLEGLEQGHSEGFSQGQEQGIEAGLAEAKKRVARFEELLTQFEKPLQLLDTDIELSLLNLTMTLAKSVIGHELKTHPEQVLSALRLGVDSLPIKDQSVNIRLHPDDIELVEQLYSSAQITRNQWQLDADPSLSAGDCIISSQRSLVDLTLSARIDTVFEHLRQQHEHLTQQQHQQQAAIEADDAEKLAKAEALQPQSSVGSSTQAALTPSVQDAESVNAENSDNSLSNTPVEPSVSSETSPNDGASNPTTTPR